MYTDVFIVWHKLYKCTTTNDNKKESLNSDGHPFHQYKKKCHVQSPLIFKVRKNTKKQSSLQIMIICNTAVWLYQFLKCKCEFTGPNKILEFIFI